MMSPSDEKRIVAMVDSFTKTVARNFSRNLKRAKANAEKHYSDEPVDYWKPCSRISSSKAACFIAIVCFMVKPPLFDVVRDYSGTPQKTRLTNKKCPVFRAFHNF